MISSEHTLKDEVLSLRKMADDLEAAEKNIPPRGVLVVSKDGIFASAGKLTSSGGLRTLALSQLDHKWYDAGCVLLLGTYSPLRLLNGVLDGHTVFTVFPVEGRD